MEAACATWYEDIQRLNNGAGIVRNRNHEHEMRLLQETIGQQAYRMRSLAHELDLAHKLRHDSSGINVEDSQGQAAHDNEMIGKQAEIEKLKRTIQERWLREIELEQALSREEDTVRNEQSLRTEIEQKLKEIEAAKKKSEDIAMELRFELWDHKPGMCVQTSRLRAQGKITNAKLVGMQANYEQKFDVLLDECSKLRSELKRVQSQSKAVVAAGITREDLKKIKQIEKEKTDWLEEKKRLCAQLAETEKKATGFEYKLDETSKTYEAKIEQLLSEYEAKLSEASKATAIPPATKQNASSDAGKTLSSLKAKLTQLKTAYTALSQQHQQCAESTTISDSLRTELAAKNAELAEKSQAYDELVMAKSSGNSDEFAALQAEVLRLRNIEQEKAAAEAHAQEAISRLQQAEATIAAQQGELQRLSGIEQESDAAKKAAADAMQQMQAANEQHQSTIQRANALDADKAAAETRAAQAAAYAQQLEASDKDQQGKLAWAEQRISTLESEVQRILQQGGERVSAAEGAATEAKKLQMQQLTKLTKEKFSLNIELKKAQTTLEAEGAQLSQAQALLKGQGEQIMRLKGEVRRLNEAAELRGGDGGGGDVPGESLGKKSEFLQMQAKYRDVVEENEELYVDIEGKDERIGELKNENLDLKGKVRKLEGALKQVEAQVAEKQQAIQMLSEMASRKRTCNECANLRTRIEELEEQVNGEIERSTALAKECEKLKLQLQQLEAR